MQGGDTLSPAGRRPASLSTPCPLSPSDLGLGFSRASAQPAERRFSCRVRRNRTTSDRVLDPRRPASPPLLPLHSPTEIPPFSPLFVLTVLSPQIWVWAGHGVFLATSDRVLEFLDFSFDDWPSQNSHLTVAELLFSISLSQASVLQNEDVMRNIRIVREPCSNVFLIGDKFLCLTPIRHNSATSWGNAGVEYVVKSGGVFTDKERSATDQFEGCDNTIYVVDNKGSAPTFSEPPYPKVITDNLDTIKGMLIVARGMTASGRPVDVPSSNSVDGSYINSSNTGAMNTGDAGQHVIEMSGLGLDNIFNYTTAMIEQVSQEHNPVIFMRWSRTNASLTVVGSGTMLWCSPRGSLAHNALGYYLSLAIMLLLGLLVLVAAFWISRDIQARARYVRAVCWASVAPLVCVAGLVASTFAN